MLCNRSVTTNKHKSGPKGHLAAIHCMNKLCDPQNKAFPDNGNSTGPMQTTMGIPDEYVIEKMNDCSC